METRATTRTIRSIISHCIRWHSRSRFSDWKCLFHSRHQIVDGFNRNTVLMQNRARFGIPSYDLFGATTMCPISSIYRITEILALILVARATFWKDETVVETLYWTPENGHDEWEFSVIGDKVPWNEAKILCSSENSLGPSLNDESVGNDATREDSTRLPIKDDSHFGNRLAVLHENNATFWLPEMISESNYRYDGLWIGGYRKNSSNHWTWIEDEERKEVPIPWTSVTANYAKWRNTNNTLDRQETKNCLMFDRVGHNLPVLAPADCNLLKPFVCSRIVRKKIGGTIVEGKSVIIEGLRYTIFSVDEGEELRIADSNLGYRRLNGGGVTWMDARRECRIRGQYLASVLSTEAAKKIASIMMKNRPSMESIWLGASSQNGTEWRWSTTGLSLPVKRSSTMDFPPWLSGHPNPNSQINGRSKVHGRCLILDRHLCPERISPVFLDVDCQKKRPFVCQHGPIKRPKLQLQKKEVSEVPRRIFGTNGILEFSTDRMFWDEGRTYCSKNNSQMASIVDRDTLSAVLERMADLHIDHVWLGGRTQRTEDGWRWLDETGNIITRENIGTRSSWCFGNANGTTLPVAEPNICLNLDREGHGLPLFYGLPCNSTRQRVLCNLNTGPSNASLNLSVQIDRSKDFHELAKSIEPLQVTIRSLFPVPVTPEEKIQTNSENTLFSTSYESHPVLVDPSVNSSSPAAINFDSQRYNSTNDTDKLNSSKGETQV